MRRRTPAPKNPSLIPSVIAEYHFSPMEHAAFMELEDDIGLDRLLDDLFPQEAPRR